MNRELMLNWRESLTTRLQAGLDWLQVTPKHWLLAGATVLLINTWLLSVLFAPGPAEEQLYSFDTASTATRPSSTPAPPTVAPPPPVAGNSHPVQGRPTIDPARIETVLQQYRSPATGSGQAIYDLGVRYGIDPAYALAFFVHESSAGTQGVATITKSIGNIRCTPGYDCYQTGSNGSFRRYPSWEAGAEDWYKLLKELYIGKWGLLTLEQIIPVYAPSADRNNPASYIQHVARLVEGWQK